MKPLISIITPVFNSEKTIESCIQSIKKQNNPNIEHIIIDGLSRDTTVDIIKKYQGTYNMVWLSEKDSGIADAMNKGFKLATGQFVAWIDADNYYDDTVYEYIFNTIKTHPEIDVMCGFVDVVDGNNIKTYKPDFPFTYEKSLLKNTGGIPVQPGVFFRKELFDKVHGFNTAYKVAGDYDFWVKVLKLNPKISYSESVFGYYKKEELGASQSAKGIIKGLKEMLLIGKEHGQTLRGKVMLVIKYSIGLLSIYKKNIIKKYAK